MPSTITGSLASYALVAGAAAAISAFATWGATKVVTPSLAQTAPGGAQQILLNRCRSPRARGAYDRPR